MVEDERGRGNDGMKSYVRVRNTDRRRSVWIRNPRLGTRGYLWLSGDDTLDKRKNALVHDRLVTHCALRIGLGCGESVDGFVHTDNDD